MKLSLHLKAEIELTLPGHNFTSAKLRELYLLKRSALEDLHPDMTVRLTIVLFCTAAQRGEVAALLGFIPAGDFCQVHAARLDFGAWGAFRFKWAH